MATDESLDTSPSLFLRQCGMLCHRKEANAMRKTLKDFYSGSIRPCEQQMAASSDLRRAAEKLSRYEQQLIDRLGEADQALLAELVSIQHNVDSITAQENFILGFRLDVRMMIECMDEDDGNIQNMEDSES